MTTARVQLKAFRIRLLGTKTELETALKLIRTLFKVVSATKPVPSRLVKDEFLINLKVRPIPQGDQ
jgi:hypothetical protein